jgi:hypothetical protein
LSGPKVLACRKGKCSEFATLFASLSRAAGIPTRIALGERMIPGQWGGLMWNEVYVGRWIPVDAGANEVGKSAVLVKLIDHETVEGTQPLRQALPASFEIAIKDYRSKPARLAGKFSTGIARRVYTNAELGNDKRTLLDAKSAAKRSRNNDCSPLANTTRLSRDRRVRSSRLGRLDMRLLLPNLWDNSTLRESALWTVERSSVCRS